MPEPIKQEEAPKVEDLVKQVENLNKAVASTRDEVRSANEKAKKTEEEFNKYKTEVEPKLKKLAGETKVEEDVQLSEKDQKRLEAWAESKGFVKKDEFEAEKLRIAQESAVNVQKQAVSEFLQKYPKYDDDSEWKKVLSEFQQYKVPSDIDGYRKLLTKIHKELNGGKVEDEAATKVRIQDLTRNRLGLGRGASGGFDASAETVESLQARYPNLGKDAIAQRLKELKSLYPDKKK